MNNVLDIYFLASAVWRGTYLMNINNDFYNLDPNVYNKVTRKIYATLLKYRSYNFGIYI